MWWAFEHGICGFTHRNMEGSTDECFKSSMIKKSRALALYYIVLENNRCMFICTHMYVFICI